jgi:hypothetical protein
MLNGVVKNKAFTGFPVADFASDTQATRIGDCHPKMAA